MYIQNKMKYCFPNFIAERSLHITSEGHFYEKVNYQKYSMASDCQLEFKGQGHS